ncbi:MAG: DUF3990 domain-containing protein [Eubacterium sp.]|nr:DUF3990 domain-containing protein [Eubacterium sp.]
MRLYHTGKIEIQNPDIRYGRLNADFGQGFYLTPDLEFSYRWAGKDSVINVYEMNLDGLKLHEFKRDAEWLNYIFSNRRLKDTLDADVIIGPIANDTIYDTLGILSSGYLSQEEALRLLMIGPQYIQLVIKTDKARERLRWIESKANLMYEKYAEDLKKEQEEYQKLFAEEMERLT